MVAPSFDVPDRRLPVVTLYVTERCNSRCITCDYWRNGHADLDLDVVRRLMPDFAALGTRIVVLSGGEPLLHRHWPEIVAALKSAGLDVWLLTSGLALAKHAERVARLFDAVTVSLDGTNSATYAAIRGLDAFDKVCEGIRALAGRGLAPGLRVTLQRANYRELADFVILARQLGARSVSFLAVDLESAQAFGRGVDFATGAALEPSDLAVFAKCLAALEREHAEDFRAGFIAESPAKLQRLLEYFAARRGLNAYPEVRCNAPEFSAVIEATGRVRPCFFIPGPLPAQLARSAAAPIGLRNVLASDSMRALREAIRSGARSECKTCVCSMWRDPSACGGARAEASS